LATLAHFHSAPLEHEPGDAYRARAATFFVQAITDLLFDTQGRPQHEAAHQLDAIAWELTEVSDDARAELIPRIVQNWATRWHLNCPCVRAWADNVVALRARNPSMRLVGMGFGREIPAEVWSRLAEWNDTTLDATGTDPRTYGQAVDPDYSTAPPAPNPYVEPREKYLRRAGRVWDARADVLRAHGDTHSVPAPALKQHCEWLARYQFGETPSVIAQTPGETATVEAVERAIVRLRPVLGLRAPRPGGRPKTR
jgi:hypothetical protein